MKVQLVPNWQQRAACQYVDPEMFFVERGENANAMAQAAKKVCRSCPVLAECYKHVMSLAVAEDQTGIVAATTYKERLRKRRLAS